MILAKTTTIARRGAPAGCQIVCEGLAAADVVDVSSVFDAANRVAVRVALYQRLCRPRLDLPAPLLSAALPHARTPAELGPAWPQEGGRGRAASSLSTTVWGSTIMAFVVVSVRGGRLELQNKLIFYITENCQMPSAREALPYLHLFLIFVCFKEKSNLKISTRRTHLNEKGTCRIDVCDPGTRSAHVPSQRDA